MDSGNHKDKNIQKYEKIWGQKYWMKLKQLKWRETQF
jgi:hypothetical protein